MPEATDHPEITALDLRERLLSEELEELRRGLIREDYVEVADAIADCIYVLIGTGVQWFGREKFARVIEEVWRSNETKISGGVIVRRDDGKALKPEGYQPPRIREILYP